MSNDNNFNSIEKMMEFGMSMSIAQQMMQTMNHAMSQMQTPQFNNVNMPVPVPRPAPKQFYALVNDIPQGPFTESELTGHIVAGRVQKTTMVWLLGMPSWMPAEQVMDVNKLFALVPPPIK